MKTKSIFTAFLAFAGSAYAQWDNATGANSTLSDIGIGTVPVEKLHIATSVSNRGLRISQTFNGGCRLLLNNQSAGGRDWALYSLGNGNAQGAGHFLIYEESSAANRLFIQSQTGNVGIGTVVPANNKLLVVGSNSAIRGEASGTGAAVGISGTAGGPTNNRGGFFQATASPGAASHAVYAEINNPNGGGVNYGIYASVFGNSTGGIGPNYAGFFNGDVVTTSAGYYFSDKRMKKDIVGINNSLTLISKLNPVTYLFRIEENPGIVLPAEKQYGFIAQEVQQLIPEFTKAVIHPAKLDEMGKEIIPAKEALGLNYNGFIALLTKGMQEQQQQIEKLQQQVEYLTQNSSAATGINTTGHAEPGFTLSQNRPNPFSHEAVIEYAIPSGISNAYIAVYDLAGKQMASFPIDQKERAAITITSEKLAAGVYIYSIIADGRLSASKRLVVAEK